MSDETARREVLEILRQEFGAIRIHVHELALSLARVEERLNTARENRERLGEVAAELDAIKQSIVEMAGKSGKNGRLGDLSAKVDGHGEKLESLLLSRAALIGYALASGGAAAAAVRYLLN